MDITTIALSSLGIGLGILIQTMIGFAAPLIALPVLLMIMPLQQAIGLMSIFLCLFSINFVYKHWQEIDKRILWELGCGTVIGMPIGIYILKVGNPIVLKKIFGVLIILYCVYYYTKQRKVEIIAKMGLTFGLVGGIFSGLYSNGSPLFVTYINNKLDTQKIIRSTIIGILGIGNLLRVPMLLGAGILTVDLAKTALFILPTFLVSIYLGHKLHKKMNEENLKQITMIFLLISAILLIVR